MYGNIKTVRDPGLIFVLLVASLMLRIHIRFLASNFEHESHENPQGAACIIARIVQVSSRQIQFSKHFCKTWFVPDPVLYKVQLRHIHDLTNGRRRTIQGVEFNKNLAVVFLQDFQIIMKVSRALHSRLIFTGRAMFLRELVPRLQPQAAAIMHQPHPGYSSLHPEKEFTAPPSHIFHVKRGDSVMWWGPWGAEDR
ncbi:uncharacterized protein N7515_000747 [Penicillium bovifimosum]|uniref:Uncharacterized protein n=1 Tax=Penicillium bovifimosum TaxID=126998 RepID=A0A9W9LBU6_9EURO|nr:uncharacterized protein N7515_000747 [Penicillium bovifimosum]KAJ5146183.1 hypothetical protein N7515_000747 [Penicillium bovifimosum]